MKVVIIGGGLTGVVSAYELEKKGIDYLLIEQEPLLGGLCRTIRVNNFFFDYTGHFLHFSPQEEYVKKFVNKILKNNLLKICRNSQVYTKYANTKNKLIPYPFQANIKFLLPHQRKQCIFDLLSAHLKYNDNKIENFSIWLNKKFGTSITKIFFSPYNTKLWKTKLNDITISWVKQFIPTPDVESILKDVIEETPKNIQYGYNAYFYYPKYGGIQSLIDNIANLLSKNKVLTSAKVVNIQHKKKYVEFIYKDKLYTVRYDKIISTIPLPQLGKIISSDNIIKLWTHKFKYTSVICYNIAINKPIKRSIHWIYFPDKEIPFYRVGFYHNVNKNLVPKNKGAVYVEVSTNKIVNETAFYHNIVKTLISTNIVTSKDEILFYQFLTIPYAYVVYDKYREEVLPLVLRRLKQNDIYSIGRYGGWKYSYMSENIKDAIETVKYINER